MTRANPFGDLDDFAPDPAPKPAPAAAIDRIAESAGFPSRKARSDAAGAGKGATAPAPAPARTPRRRTTGRNRQINIKATEAVIDRLYEIADTLDLPLGAVLERALDALVEKTKAP